MERRILMFLLLAIEASYTFPQGFFSQGLSLPRFFQVDSRSQSVDLPLNIKVESPVKSSLFNIFGSKTNSGDTSKSRKEPAGNEVKSISAVPNKGNQHSILIDDNYSKVKTHQKLSDDTNKEIKAMDFVHFKEAEILKSVTDNEIIDTETTTEYFTETTDDYETTTFLDEIFNRSGASPALVATLLG